MQMPTNLGEDYTTRYRRIFPAVALEKKCVLIPFLLDGVGGDPTLNQADLIHPTANGQRLIANTVWRTLAPLISAP